MAGSSCSFSRRLGLDRMLPSSEVGGTHFKNSNCKVKLPLCERILNMYICLWWLQICPGCLSAET